MKTITTALSLFLLSAMAFPQSLHAATVEADGECIPCRAGKAQEPVQISREMNQIFDATKTSQRYGAQKVIELEAHEAGLQEAEDARDQELNRRMGTRSKRFAITIDNPSVFDQQTAEEVARAMKLRGLENTTVVDVYLLRERDEAEKAEVLARLRKALKIVMAPVVNDVRRELREYRDGLKAKAAPENQASAEKSKSQWSVAPPSSESEPELIPQGTKKDYNIASKVVDSFRFNGSSVVMQVFGSNDAETTRTLEVVKKRGETGRLELRLAKNRPGRMTYGIAADAKRADGRSQGAVYFYVGCPLDANFECTK